MGDCTCIDCKQPANSWVCDECIKKRENKRMKEHSLWLSIKKVIEDKNASNEEKLERIETYMEAHEINNKPSMSDMV